IGAAPRYMGSNDAWRLMQPSLCRLSIQGGMIRPYATTRMASGAIASRRPRNSGLSLIFSGCVTSRPVANAVSFTGGGVTCCERPTGRSGCDTTNAISCPAAIKACKVGTANCGVPQNTSFTALPGAFALHLADLAQHQVALQRAHAEDEQHSVEVVALVLKRARARFFAVQLR